MKITIEYTLDLEGMEGVEGKTSKEIFRQWLTHVIAANVDGDVISHLIADAIREAIDKSDEVGFSITKQEYLFAQISLVRAKFPGQMTRLYVQLLRKFGIELPPYGS